MEDLILISNLNDFIFCPVSIYFHKLYGNQDNLTYQSQYQINGTKAHEKVDNKKYSTRKSVKMALDVYSDEYKIVGKIDLYDEISKTLIERKKFVKKIYDGYIFQLYAQYYAMTEMGYEINHLEVRSLDDNKKYKIALPDDDVAMKNKFKQLINQMRLFDMDKFEQTNKEKCSKCIYEQACDKSLIKEGIYVKCK